MRKTLVLEAVDSHNPLMARNQWNMGMTELDQDHEMRRKPEKYSYDPEQRQ
jgi:hypothetical protein